MVKTADNLTDGLRLDNTMLKDQVAYLQEQVTSKGDADDAIMVQVDRKVEEWKVSTVPLIFPHSHLPDGYTCFFYKTYP